MKLTNTFVSRVKCKDKEKIRYVDSNLTSLVLEVKSNGVKTFYYKYTSETKTKYKKLDNYPNLSLDEARNLVQTELNKLIKPINTSNLTLQQFYKSYYLPFIQTSKCSFKSDNSFFVNHILPNLGNIPLNIITRASITKLHLNLLEANKLAPSSANKLIKYLSYMFNTAMLWEIGEVKSNPTKGIKLFKEDNTVERYLNKKEIQLILNLAQQQSNPLIYPIIQFLLLTGARKSEVLNAKWSDIDLTNNIFTIPTSKSGKIRRIPISNKLKQILQTLPKHSTYLFPSNQNNSKPLQKLDYYWHKIRTKANLEDVRIHDLRHTFASTLVNNGISLYEVQKLLGHSNIAVTQRYAHLANESLFKAVDVAGELVGDDKD